VVPEHKVNRAFRW